MIPLDPEAEPAETLELEASAPGELAAVAARLPDPAALPPGGWLALSTAERKTSLWGRVFGKSAPPAVPLAVRCTALLARGYRDVCADGGIAFGRAPLRRA